MGEKGASGENALVVAAARLRTASSAWHGRLRVSVEACLMMCWERLLQPCVEAVLV
jgi:hypothetical protein